jgi:predicted nucleic acid-binding protein
MIVADVNLIAYLWIPGDMTEHAEKALLRDSEWAAPQLWRSEFRNVLAQYYRKGLINKTVMERCLLGAESQIKSYAIPSSLVMDQVEKSTCSAYDCEYVALAESLGVRLVTADKQICKQFPETAISLREFSK